MTLPRLRELCMALPGATEQMQWGNDLVFKVGGKMFCMVCTDLAPSHQVVASFKCDDETYATLIERADVIPAPYLARAKWVALRSFGALEDREYRELIPRAHATVVASLPKKVQAQLTGRAEAGRAAVAVSAPRAGAGRGKRAQPSERRRA